MGCAASEKPKSRDISGARCGSARCTLVDGLSPSFAETARLVETETIVKHSDVPMPPFAAAPPVVWAAAVAVALVSGWLALGPLEGIPHVTDEVAYTLQSKLFAAGTRFGPVPDNESMWMLPFWVSSGPGHSPFPIGWPLLLGLGERLGLAAFVNPALNALMPPILYRIGAAVGGARLGVCAALAIACSPGVLLMGASRMAHTSVLVALGLLMVTVLERQWSFRRVMVGGLMAAYVVLARPFDAALLAAPLVLVGFRSMEWKHRPIWLGVPAAAAAGVLVDNWWMTGSLFEFPMSAWYDQWQGRTGCNRLGFGPDVGCAPTLGSFGHTVPKAMALAQEAWARYDALLLGVPGGTLVAAVGAWRLGARRGLVWVALVVVGYALYWSPGRAYGARFWHPMYLVVPVALAGALTLVPFRVAAVVCVGASAVGIRAILPDLGAGYWCVDGSLRDALVEEGITDGVVFLQADGRRSEPWSSLGVDDFSCDPMLEAGDAWAIADPTRMNGGLQFRHALRDADDTRAFMERFHPGQAAYTVEHDVANDARTIRYLGVFPSR